MIPKDQKKLPITLEVKRSGDSSTTYIKNLGDCRWHRFCDSFKRKEVQHGDEGKSLAKGINLRHLILMSLVTGVGTGLLVGSGKVLHVSGPLFLILGYAIVGSVLYPTLQAAGELAVNYSELSGGYNNYPRIFIDETISFAVTWVYFIQNLSTIATELVTASLTIQYWDKDVKINPEIWVTIFYIVILLINFVGARGYGEGEFIFGSIKLLMIVGFIIMAIVIDLGGGPEKFIGGKYWHDPGFYTNFKGLCSVFVTGVFSLSQSEFVALSAAEQPNPRKAIPIACKTMVWKIIVIYLGSLTMVGLLVPYNSSDLMGSSGDASHASPFVLAAKLHGVTVVPHIINLVILLSVTSVASSSLYSASRILQSLAEQKFAPEYFNYIDKTGRPLRALIFCSIIGLFSYIAAYKQQEVVFTWLMSISGLSQIFSWNVISMSHIRFRHALKYNGISLTSLGYMSSTGVWGSIYAIVCHWLILFAQFYIALYPVGSDKPDAKNFFENYLAACVLVVFYVGHKIWTRDWKLYIKISDIDINTGRVIFDEEVLNMEKQEKRISVQDGLWCMKIISFLFI